MPFTNQTEEKQIERAVLVGLSCPSFNTDQDADERTMDELRALAETAGAEAVAMTLQRRPAPDARTFIGEGKAEEVKQLAEMNDASLILFDNELSPSQMSNLEELTGRTVLDRSALILDIFAQRARTGEGKLQVELAQYQYILPRLAGMGKAMSRLGGGIGTRGPGESKLESDRRHIRSRIDKLRRDLEQVRQVRSVQRRQRKKAELPLVAIVGYTNAGKSTLLNTLTGAGIEANDRLFDTLDPTTRKKRISDTQEILLSDTVGFIVVIFSFLFVDIFDTLGTLIGVATKAKMLDKDGKLPGIKPALLADSIATSAGAILGTSTTTTFVESASGVAVGGRTGLTALVTGILFLVSTLFAPIFTAIPSFATAPALIMVGFLMVGTVTEINFDLDNLTESIPAYLAIIAMPLFYSISEGISLGVISYVLLNVAAGKGKKVAPLMYVLAVLFVLKYIFL